MGDLKVLIKITLVKASWLSCVTPNSEISDLYVASADAGLHFLGMYVLAHSENTSGFTLFNTEHTCSVLHLYRRQEKPEHPSARTSCLYVAYNRSDKAAPWWVTHRHQPEHPGATAALGGCQGLRQPGMNSADLQQPQGRFSGQERDLSPHPEDSTSRLRPRPPHGESATATAGPRTACALPLRKGGGHGFTISLKGTIPYDYWRISQDIKIKYQIH